MRPLTPKKQSQSGMNKDSEVDLPAKSSHQPNQSKGHEAFATFQ